MYTTVRYPTVVPTPLYPTGPSFVGYPVGSGTGVPVASGTSVPVVPVPTYPSANPPPPSFEANAGSKLGVSGAMVAGMMAVLAFII